MDFDALPASVQRIAQVLGLGATMQLHAELGGQRHYLPFAGSMPAWWSP